MSADEEVTLRKQLVELLENHAEARELGGDDDAEADELRREIEGEMHSAAKRLMSLQGVELSRGASGAVDTVYSIDWPGSDERWVCTVEERRFDLERKAPVAVVNLVGFANQREVADPSRLQRYHATIGPMQPGKEVFAAHPKTGAFERAVVERITLRGLVGVVFRPKDGVAEAAILRAEIQPWEAVIKDKAPPTRLRKRTTEMSPEELEAYTKEEAERKRERAVEKREAKHQHLNAQADSYHALMKQVSRPQPSATAPASTAKAPPVVKPGAPLTRPKPIRRER